MNSCRLTNRLDSRPPLCQKEGEAGRIVSQLIGILILLTGQLFAGLAFAQSSTNLNTIKQPALIEPTSSETGGTSELQLQRSQYTSYGQPAYRDGAPTQNSSVILRLDEQISRHGFIAKIKAKDEWSATEKWNYGDVHEFFVSYKSDVAQLSVGRKLETWSAWDSEWRQGMFQPRYMENKIRTEEAGLAGVFLNLHGDHSSVTLAALPEFIPDFGPHFYTQDDKFVSQNPWFHPPTDRFVLRAQTGSIHYKIAYPDTMSVINHPGAAAKYEYSDKGFKSRLSGAYKPLNSFLLGFPSEHQEIQGPTPNSDYMNITVSPRVAYDRIVNFDNQLTSGSWQFSGSVAYDHPDDNDGPPGWTSQQVRSATIFSGAIEKRLEDLGPHSASIRVGFLRVKGGDEEDRGPFAGKESLFERRFQYYEAYMLAAKKEFRQISKNPLETEVRLIYDRMQGGGVISFSSGMAFGRHFRADLEADFIGLLTANANITDGFLSTYRANDRVGLGMGYVF